MLLRRTVRRRRGLVLLVVLSLLAIFTLIAVSFVLVASQARRTSVATARFEQRGDDPHSLLHRAMLQVLCGTRNPLSVLRPHSLLEDMYGNDAVTGIILQPTTPLTTSGVILEVRVQFDPQFYPGPGGANDPFNMATRFLRSGYFDGCVLTMTTGQLAGRSTRIVRYEPTNNTFFVHIRAFGAGPKAGASASLPWPMQGDAFLINGRPFNGTGFGLGQERTGISGGRSTIPTDQSGRLGPILRAQDGDLLSIDNSKSWPRALLPNPVFTSIGSGYTDLLGNDDPAGPGGSDESYDAVDFQNLLLAMQHWGAISATTMGVRTPLPSLHRPDLVSWWFGQQNIDLANTSSFDAVQVMSDLSNDLLVALQRKALLRPNPADHPQFPGNNVQSGIAFHPLYGYGDPGKPRWDVDNDGDGIEDSIWVDLGFPAQAMPDGRWYKPLFAILCIDMDGRLNLNAHGNANHLVEAATTQVAGPYAGSASGTLMLTPGQYAFHFGQGYGPADVNLRRVLPPDPNGTFDHYRNLLAGVNGIEGRYGELFGAVRDSAGVLAKPGYTEDSAQFTANPNGPRGALYANSRFAMTNLWQVDMPVAYAFDAFQPRPLAQGTPDGYGTSVDMDGDGILALDHRGLPYYASIPTALRLGPHGFGEPGEMLNDPYELDLSDVGSKRWLVQPADSNHPALSPVDAPFTAEEFERVLRKYDSDADYLAAGSGSSVPILTRESRLSQLAPTLMVKSFTTDPLLPNADLRALHLITTSASWDVPVPGVTPYLDNLVEVPSPAAGNSNQYPTPRVQDLNIQDLLAARLQVENPGMAADQINVALRNLLPPELMAGLRMDLNRAFGNGRDDNGNGVVDEPAEAPVEAFIAPSRVMTRGPVAAQMDFNNDGTVDVNDTLARQNYAKHLYVLMMLLMDEEFRTKDGWQPPQGSGDTLEQAVAKRIAQWCANVVDFRDRDAINTGFEFDLEPFKDNNLPSDGNSWDVDGIIQPQSNFGAEDQATTREVVWGCERPELLITEAIATHERRTSDDTVGQGRKEPTSDNNDQDDDYDQIARPRGAVAVELFNPGSPWDAMMPDVHGNYPGSFGVELTRISGTDPLNPGAQPSPVWRIVTRRNAIYGGDAPPQTLDDPEHYRPVLNYPGEPDPVDIGRIAYFTTNNDPANTPNPTNRPVFHREDDAPMPDVVRPRHYALVGPAGRSTDDNEATNAGSFFRLYFGQRDSSQDGATKKNLYPYFLQLSAGPNRDVGPYRRIGNTPNYRYDRPPNAKQIVGVVLAPRVVGNNMAQFSISEPDNGYDTTPLSGRPEQFNPNAFYTAPLDAVEDQRAELRLDGFSPQGTSMVYLERLADPTRPWDERANPYITLDRAFVGLRTFRGEPDPTHQGAQAEFQGGPYVPDNEDLDTFRRGSEPNPGDVRAAARNVWSPWTAPDNVTDITTGSLNRPLTRSSMGYLNGFDQAAAEYGPAFDNTLPPTGQPGANPVVQVTDYVSEPMVDAGRPPMPWLTWNNRPFVSPAELLMVPATSQPGLLLEHGVRDNTVNPYAPPTTNNATQAQFQDVFRHLLNMFNGARSAPGAPNPNARGEAPELYRLFDYVYVPSPYAGTWDLLDPTEFTGSATHLLHPPYNRLSRYREPGKINLNTIFDPRVWDALTDGAFGPPDASLLPARWADFVQSRQGYATSAGRPGPFQINPASPTMFANPFRSAGENAFVPPVPRNPQNQADLTALQQSQDVDVTLLRKRFSTTGSASDPLFATIGNGAPMHADPDRNPYFRYAGLEKIWNNVTTRSNVYAVWITVGYFEVKRVRINAGHPDGWTLGKEIGWDTGDIRRHRAFYMLDRTIPVGFQRGEPLNAEDTLLIQRYLE